MVALGAVVTAGEPFKAKRGIRILRDGVTGVGIVVVAAGVMVTVESEDKEAVDVGSRGAALAFSFFSLAFSARWLSSSRSFLFLLFFSGFSSLAFSSGSFFFAARALFAGFAGAGAVAGSIDKPFRRDRFESVSSSLTRTRDREGAGALAVAKGGVDTSSSSAALRVFVASAFLLRDLSSLVLASGCK